MTKKRHRRVVVLSEVDKARLEAGECAPALTGPAASALPTRASEDMDEGWGGGSDSNDRRLLEDVPPHWGGRAGQ